LPEAEENGKNKAKERRRRESSPRMKVFIKKPEVFLRAVPPRKEEHPEL
jgi:hypothetical protein